MATIGGFTDAGWKPEADNPDAMRHVEDQQPSQPEIVRTEGEAGAVAAATRPGGCRVFDRVVCASDASRFWLEAVRQACLLGSGVGQIELVGVIQTVADEYSAYGASAAVSEGEHSLARRLADAQAVCSRASIELLQGPMIARLLDLLEERDATLVAVGAASRHREIGIVRGDVATGMLHRAPSSVLVARAATTAAAFPQSVVVGYDGSVGANAALSVARDLADRFDASVRLIAAGDASTMQLEALAELTLDRDQRSPVEALLDASCNADLLIVGSRGLHGLRALGSVSERVGHQASCSVLVVREQPTT